MKSKREAAKYFPTVTAAKRARVGLPSAAPVEQHKLCALVVHAEAVVREVWSEQVALSPREFEKLDRVAPSTTKAGAMHHVLGAELKRTRHWIRCRVDHHNNVTREIHDAWLPAELGDSPTLHHFEMAFEEVVLRATPPEALRCVNLQPRRGGSAYRSGPAKQVTDFHGWAFGNTIRRAGRAVSGLGKHGAVLNGTVRAYAWPVLWLRYARTDTNPVGDYVLFVGPQGQLRACAGSDAKAEAGTSLRF